MWLKYFVTFIVSILLFMIGLASMATKYSDGPTLLSLILYIGMVIIIYFIFIINDSDIYNIFKKCKKVYIELDEICSTKTLISQSDINEYYSILPVEMKAKKKDLADIVIKITIVNTYGSESERRGSRIYTYDVPETDLSLDFIEMKTLKRLRVLKNKCLGHDVAMHESIKEYLKYSFKPKNLYYFILARNSISMFG
ncbi:hypothetical protein KAR48_06290 [bacterium]|nr:hypothetical protein [bacterium]